MVILTPTVSPSSKLADLRPLYLIPPPIPLFSPSLSLNLRFFPRVGSLLWNDLQVFKNSGDKQSQATAEHSMLTLIQQPWTPDHESFAEESKALSCCGESKRTTGKHRLTGESLYRRFVVGNSLKKCKKSCLVRKREGCALTHQGVFGCVLGLALQLS